MSLSCLPKYMNDVLKFPILENGLLLSLPFVAMLTVAYTSAVLADVLINRSILRRTTVRKIYGALCKSKYELISV